MSKRTSATPHPLEPASDENLSNKARVERNVLHIRGESELKFDVNEESWPNADLAIRSSYEGALIDGLPADKVKAGDEREIKQMKDLQLYSWVKETDGPPSQNDLAHWLGSTTEGERSEIKMCAEGFRDNSERSSVCAYTISMVSAWTIAVRSMVRPSSRNWRPCVCAFMQADSPSKTYARTPKGQERDGWIWRLHGAMNGMRTASRDFAEFLAGVVTECMGFKRGKLERCLFIHESNEVRVVSHIDDSLI